MIRTLDLFLKFTWLSLYLYFQLLEAGQVGSERIAQLKSKYSQLYEHVKG